MPRSRDEVNPPPSSFPHHPPSGFSLCHPTHRDLGNASHRVAEQRSSAVDEWPCRPTPVLHSRVGEDSLCLDRPTQGYATSRVADEVFYETTNSRSTSTVTEFAQLSYWPKPCTYNKAVDSPRINRNTKRTSSTSQAAVGLYTSTRPLRYTVCDETERARRRLPPLSKVDHQ